MSDDIKPIKFEPTATQRMRAILMQHYNIGDEDPDHKIPIHLTVSDDQMAAIVSAAAGVIQERHDAAMTNIEARLEAGDQRMAALDERTGAVEAGLAENTALTKTVATSTAEIVEIFSAAKGFFKFLDRVGRLARPIWVIAVAVGAVAGAITAIMAAWRAASAGTSVPVAAAEAFKEMMRYVKGEV